MKTPLSEPRRQSRFIAREQLGDCRHWQFDAVDASALALADAQRAAAEQVREQAAQQALAAAQARGYAQGLAQGRAQGSAQTALEWQERMDAYRAGPGRDCAQRMQALLQAFDASLGQAQQQLAPQLLELACSIARQVLREQLCVNPLALLPVLREALSLLASDGRPTTVRLNPADHAALAQPLRERLAAPDLHWLADAAVAPGGCVLDCAGSVVDASLATRWRRAIASIGLDLPWQQNDRTEIGQPPDRAHTPDGEHSAPNPAHDRAGSGGNGD